MIPSSFKLWSFAFPRLRKGLRAVGGGAFLRRNGVTSSALLERLLLPPTASLLRDRAGVRRREFAEEERDKGAPSLFVVIIGARCSAS